MLGLKVLKIIRIQRICCDMDIFLLAEQSTSINPQDLTDLGVKLPLEFRISFFCCL